MSKNFLVSALVSVVFFGVSAAGCIALLDLHANGSVLWGLGILTGWMRASLQPTIDARFKK